MSSRALESRASASSSDRSAESHPSAPRSATASSTASEQRPRRQKGSSSHLSGHSSDHSAASDSSPSHTSSSTQISTPSDPSRHRHSHQTHQNKANSSSSKQTSARHLQEAHFLPNSTASSGFSSAMSDTSAHSTSGTSSPYASGVGGGGGSTSVFSTQRLSPADIKYRDERPKVVRSFIIGKLIGEGSYGKVKEGIDSKTKKMVAIKILSKKTLRRVPGGEASIEREIGIIESLKHKHVVSIHSHFPVEAKQKFYIVCEYMGGGTLSSLLESAPGKKLPLHQARKLFLHLVAGLEHLREHRILHRDIKPDNLLLTSSGELKIGDFGVADVISSDPNEKLKADERSGIGSPAFQAPELISSPNASSSTSSSSSTKKSKRSASDLIFKSDIWSAGIILFIMVVGEYPFPIQGNIMLLFEDIAAGKYQVPDWVDPDCSDLIKQMLHTNPAERIDLVGIKAHAFLKNAVTKSSPSVVPPPIHSMWPHHDKTSLSSVLKKLKPQLERQEAQERAERRAFGDEDDFDDDGDGEEGGGGGDGKRRRKKHTEDDNGLLDSASDDSEPHNGSNHSHSNSRDSHHRSRDSRSSSSKCIVM